jgi:mannitol-1-phosphate/altronate dehydrogenase
MTIEQFVEEVLGNENLWEMNLNKIAGLTASVTEYLQQMNQKGMNHALEMVLEEQSAN